MNKFSPLLKTIKDRVVSLLSKQQKYLINNNPLLSKKIDQKLVFGLSPKKFPSLAQLKTLPKFLNPAEKRLAKTLSAVIVVCLILLIGNFYFSHTVLVPQVGGSYTEGLVGTPQYINPILSSYNDVDRDLTKLLFNGLLKINDEGVLVPDLAEGYQISPDRKTYTFKLRANVTWHDGEILTADDVIFTVTSIQDPSWQSQLSSALGNVQVEKIDDYTLRFILKDPVANFINSLTFGILPAHLWSSIPPSNAALAELNKKPIGTGPFKFQSLTKDKNGNIRTMSLVRNENYYDNKAYINDLIFKFYGDFETASTALANNNIEGLGLLPKEYYNKVSKNKNIKFYSLSLPQYTAIFFNTKKSEALKNQTVRQALAYAINRQDILDQAIGQEGTIVNGPILPGFLGFNPDIKKYNYDPEQAKQLLIKAGWKADADGLMKKNNEPLQITLTTGENAEYVKAAEIIKKNWQAIGVTVTAEIISRDRIRTDTIEPRNYQTLLFGQVTKADPLPFWHSKEIESPGVNLAVWANKDIDKILEEARGLDDPQAVAKKYIQFQDILAEAVPAIFLYNPIQTYPVSEKILGLTTRRISTMADRFNLITNWYIKTNRHFSWKLPQKTPAN
ncbi:MAG: peptide ABC transporter substrate-binding protein [Candidatus Komeilibacteria bacterium]|nr:peptide ABC transporter substrate-binding protein [Candidatus Komeilibacteria bacterium]